MAINTTLAGLSQSYASNGPDGGSDAPSTMDDAIKHHGAFIATLRDGKGFAAEADVASAATCDIGGANSLFVRITGTTTITSFGINFNGPRFIRFGGALTLTHNASTLILPGGANITTAAGDTCVVTPISGGWVVSKYQRADGKVLVGALTSGTYTTLSGASVDFLSAPNWAKRVTIVLPGLSTTGTSVPIVQVGDSGGVEATGYLGATMLLQSGSATVGSNFTTGVGLCGQVIAGSVLHVVVTLTLADAATNTWIASVVGSMSSAANSIVGSSTKSLSGTLDRVRITTVGGSDTFDLGSASILYE